VTKGGKRGRDSFIDDRSVLRELNAKLICNGFRYVNVYMMRLTCVVFTTAVSHEEESSHLSVPIKAGSEVPLNLCCGRDLRVLTGSPSTPLGG
jgi:hypothetical protein